MVDPFIKHREFTVTTNTNTYIYKNAMKTYKITVTKKSFKFSIEEETKEEAALKFLSDFSFLFTHKHLNHTYNVFFNDEEVAVTKLSSDETITVFLGSDGKNRFENKWDSSNKNAKRMFDFLSGPRVAQFFRKAKSIFMFWANFFNKPGKGPNRDLYFHTEKVINQHINIFDSFFSQF